MSEPAAGATHAAPSAGRAAPTAPTPLRIGGIRPTWRLIVDPPADGATNMARDRALLDQLVAGERPATLRFYGWSPACVSLGLGQKDDVLDLDAVRRAGLDVVRRPTGGQALLHDDELTYSVVASQADPVVGGTLMATYHAITEALLRGLLDLGVDGQGAPCEPRPASGVTPVCFASASAEEVLVGGRKLLASAQWRSRGAFLQHGSLLLTDRQVDLPALMRDEAARALRPISVSLAEMLPRVPSRERLVEALAAGFAEVLGIRLVLDTAQHAGVKSA
ncbi:MAG TPA: lipoate--protein ligase family protein [Candidatus Dormibacteraeota bacterium]|nr:lipoate--protein ligase family protein [Candidatus Dormibacteraeota bacterium]